jgi:hypothetical protein
MRCDQGLLEGLLAAAESKVPQWLLAVPASPLHPLASHVEKLIPKLLVFRQTSKSHALARVAFTFVVGCHDGAPWITGESATGLSATGAELSALIEMRVRGSSLVRFQALHPTVCARTPAGCWHRVRAAYATAAAQTRMGLCGQSSAGFLQIYATFQRDNLRRHF